MEVSRSRALLQEIVSRSYAELRGAFRLHVFGRWTRAFEGKSKRLRRMPEALLGTLLADGDYFTFVAFPSMTLVHGAPSVELSKEYV